MTDDLLDRRGASVYMYSFEEGPAYHSQELDYGGHQRGRLANTMFTQARLAVVPGYSHYNFASAAEIAPIVEKFLVDP